MQHSLLRSSVSLTLLIAMLYPAFIPNPPNGRV